MVRLVLSLAPEVERVRAIGGEVAVVVVIDGSTDGTTEALAALDVPFVLDVRWQEHRGLAAARNTGLQAVLDGLVLFFDDDLIPNPGLLDRHYASHVGSGTAHVLLGPCRPLPAKHLSAEWLQWWEEHIEELSRSGRVERFDQFTAANASGPADVFTGAGGFNEAFVGYGFEDFELGVRLLGRHVTILYDSDASAVHDHRESRSTAIARERSIGRNSVLVATLHPELKESVFPSRPRSHAVKVVGAIPVRSPIVFRCVAWIAGRLALTLPRVPETYRKFARDIAHSASFAAGVAEADPQFLSRVLDGPHS